LMFIDIYRCVAVGFCTAPVFDTFQAYHVAFAVFAKLDHPQGLHIRPALIATHQPGLIGKNIIRRVRFGVNPEPTLDAVNSRYPANRQQMIAQNSRVISSAFAGIN